MEQKLCRMFIILLFAVLLAACLPAFQAIAPVDLLPGIFSAPQPLPTIIPTRTPTPRVSPTRAATSSPVPSQTAFVLTPPATAMPVKPSPTPRQLNSSITGSVNNAGDPKRKVFVVAYRAGGEGIYGTVLNGSGSFSIPVSPGAYYVVAYGLPGRGDDPSEARWVGGFTHAINCKKADLSGEACQQISKGCKDHSLIQVNVTDGNSVGPLQPDDFTAPVGAYPPMPSTRLPATIQFPARDRRPGTIDRARAIGWISGLLSGPNQKKTAPYQRMVAFLDNSTQWYSMDGSGPSYQFELPPGRYTLVSYKNGASAGYAQCDQVSEGGGPLLDGCGTPVLACRLRDVIVQAGQNTTGVDIANWYVGSGRYPAPPFSKK
jgi:hypothetical protein